MFTGLFAYELQSVLWLVSVSNAPPAPGTKPLLAAEAKKNQQVAGKQFGKGKIAFPKTGKSYEKPIHVEKSVASQFDVSQGDVYAAQKIKRKQRSARYEGNE